MIQQTLEQRLNLFLFDQSNNLLKQYEDARMEGLSEADYLCGKKDMVREVWDFIYPKDREAA